MKFALLQVNLTLNNHWLDPSKQDSDSNLLKGSSKILHHAVKSKREKQWFWKKVATFQNNKKKHWFSYKTGLVFMHGNVFKDRLGALPHLRWTSLQQFVMVGFTTNRQ